MKKEKFLCLSLDSNSYSTLYVDVVESADDAVMKLLSREANDGDGLTTTVSIDGCNTRITFSDNKPNQYFVEAELMPMPKTNFVAYWHAYDGVGFDLKGSSENREEAIDMLHAYVENYWKGEFDLGDYEEGDSSCTIDTGNEWECLEVFNLNEVNGYHDTEVA